MAKSKDKSESGLGRPELPRATRLNKLAVIVAAAVMSVTLLVVTLLIGQESTQEAQEQEERESTRRLPSRAAEPSFLDRPPETLPGGETFAEEVFPEADYALGSEDVFPYEEPESLPYVPPGVYGIEGYPDGLSYESAPRAEQTPEADALARALRSALTPQGFSGGAAPRIVEDEEEPGIDYEEDDFLSTLSQLQQASPPGTQTSPPAEQAAQGAEPFDNEGFLERAADTRREQTRYVEAVIEHPGPQPEIREGTLLEAFLITGIHSDLPGDVVAQVARNVYDSAAQQTLLVPKGSRLIGTYNNQVVLGQSRLLVAWTRLILPDGRSVRLPGLASVDPQGASGLTGRVNRHFMRAFGNALMLSVVGAGLGFAQRRPDAGGFGMQPTPGEILSSSVATELSRVATEILRAGINRRPTIEVEAGTAFHVFMSGDLALPPYRPQDGFLRPGP